MAAGFWLRLAAYLLDSCILAVTIMPVIMGLSMAGAGMTPGLAKGLMGLALVALLVVATMAYFVGFVALKGATPGKLAFGMRITRMDGGPVTIWRALARHMGWGLSYLFFGAGFLVAPFRKDRRALHDLIAETRVVFVA